LTAAVVTGLDSRSILGIGVDIEEIASFDTLAYDAHRQFYARVFTSDELAYCLTYAAPAEHFAARFAAKEAVVKACGALRTLIPSQVEIVRGPSGAPLARVHPGDALEADVELRVSLGHTRELAYAVALALRGTARQSASSDSTSSS
jgi:holo-[acyl-carrier protein] synthase